MVDEPMFMRNDEWYVYSYDQKKYILTEKAPAGARQSYNEYMKEVEMENSEVTENDRQ